MQGEYLFASWEFCTTRSFLNLSSNSFPCILFYPSIPTLYRSYTLPLLLKNGGFMTINLVINNIYNTDLKQLGLSIYRSWILWFREHFEMLNVQSLKNFGTQLYKQNESDICCSFALDVTFKKMKKKRTHTEQLIA